MAEPVLLSKDVSLFDQSATLLLKGLSSCVYILGTLLHVGQLEQSALIEIDQAAAFAGASLNLTPEAL